MWNRVLRPYRGFSLSLTRLRSFHGYPPPPLRGWTADAYAHTAIISGVSVILHHAADGPRRISAMRTRGFRNISLGSPLTSVTLSRGRMGLYASDGNSASRLRIPEF